MIYFLLDHCLPLNMFRKTIKNRCYVLIILFAFCISSATFGSSLLFGSDAHFHQGNVHVHHTDKDHGLGGSDHKDAGVILNLDYVVVNSANQVNIFSSLNSYLLFYNLADYGFDLSNSFSATLHYPNKCSFCTHDLYQVKSAYLI